LVNEAAAADTAVAVVGMAMAADAALEEG